MTVFAAELPDRPAIYSAKWRRPDNAGVEIVTVTRIDKVLGKAVIVREGMTDDDVEHVGLGELSSFVPAKTRPIVVAEDDSITDFFATWVYDIPEDWEGQQVDWAVGASVLEAAGNVSHPEDVRLQEQALTQCQHIAYDMMVELENAMSVNAGWLTTGELRRLAHRALSGLRRVNSIAEGGRPTIEFAKMLADSRREEDEEESTTLEPPDGCTGSISVSEAGHPLIQHYGPTCPVHEEATAADRTEELREQAGRVVEDYRAGEDVGDAVEALGTILDAVHAVRNGWIPDRDEGWIGCEVECADRVAFTVTAIGRGSEMSAMEDDDDRLVLRGGAENGQGGCWEFADAVTILHPPSEPQTERPFIRIDFLRGDVDAMAESQGIDKALAWERAQDWAKAINEQGIAMINSELSDRIAEEA